MTSLALQDTPEALSFSMDLLPNELLEKILSHLEEDDLLNCEVVSESLSEIIVARFWQPILVKKAQHDYNIHLRLVETGLDPVSMAAGEPQDRGLVKAFYLQLRHVVKEHWVHVPHQREALFRNWTPDQFVDRKPAAFLTYKNKLYVGLKNTLIQIWSLDSLEYLRDLNVLSEPRDEHALCHCTMAHHDHVMVAVDSSNLVIVAWDLKTDTELFRLKSPKSKMYEVAINSLCIVALSSWGILVWRRQGAHDVASTDALVISDFAHNMDFSDWMSCHKMQLNEDFAVTLGTWRNEIYPSMFSVSQIHIRRVQRDGQLRLVEHENLAKMFVDTLEIAEMCLSSRNLLGLLIIETRMEKTEVILYSIYVVDICRDQKVRYISETESPLAEIRIPVQWVDSKLFYKLVPKPGLDDNVSLGYWDEKDETNTLLDSIQMSTPNDLLFISNFNVVRIFNSFPLFPLHHEGGGGGGNDLAIRADISVCDYWQCGGEKQQQAC